MQIRRRGYFRSSGTYVSPATFRVSAKRSRSKVRIPLRKGGLTQYGYSVKAKESIRHHALQLAAAINGSLTVSRRLGALATLNKRRSPKQARTYRANQYWIARA